MRVLHTLNICMRASLQICERQDKYSSLVTFNIASEIFISESMMTCRSGSDCQNRYILEETLPTVHFATHILVKL